MYTRPRDQSLLYEGPAVVDLVAVFLSCVYKTKGPIFIASVRDCIVDFSYANANYITEQFEDRIQRYNRYYCHLLVQLEVRVGRLFNCGSNCPFRVQLTLFSRYAAVHVHASVPN